MNTSSTQSQFETQSGTRQERRGRNAWVFGLVLVVLGAGLLFQNIFGDLPGNWAALLLLIPAAICFGKAIQHYTAANYLNAPVRGNLLGGLIFSALAVVLFFEIDLPGNIVGPLALIAIGALIVINQILPK